MKRSLLLSLSGPVLAVVLFASFACGQSDEVVPNENLVVEGIPKIPASLADAVGRYSEFRAASFNSWNPERREMLITTRFGDTAQVHQVKAPGAARHLHGPGHSVNIARKIPPEESTHAPTHRRAQRIFVALQCSLRSRRRLRPSVRRPSPESRPRRRQRSENASTESGSAQEGVGSSADCGVGRSC